MSDYVLDTVLDPCEVVKEENWDKSLAMFVKVGSEQKGTDCDWAVNFAESPLIIQRIEEVEYIRNFNT